MVGTARTRTVATATCGAALVTAYAVVAALQILVWNPLAAVPGRNLAQIRSAMEAAGEELAAAPVLIFLAVGPVLAAAVAVLTVWGPLRDAWSVALIQLGVVAAGAPAYFMASFGPGMALADAFMISGGDHAVGGTLLYAASAAAAAALLVVAFAGQPRGRTAPARLP